MLKNSVTIGGGELFENSNGNKNRIEPHQPLVFEQSGEDSKHRYSISMIRLISLLMIITCHIMQYEDFFLAWWFNVGVQIFLCISGYLYGQAKKREVREFYKARSIKILLPYYIVVLFFSVIEAMFFRSSFSILRFVGSVFCRKTIAGGEHLWFVCYILLCYAMLPILNEYRDSCVNNAKSLVRFSLISVSIVSILFGLFSAYFDPAWMSCYVMGYCLGVNRQKNLIRQSAVIIAFAAIAILGNGVQIYLSHFLKISFEGIYNDLFCIFENYNHAFLGIFLFLLMEQVFKNHQFGEQSKRTLDITDKYSYETYLVHQFFILGPLSLMELTSFFILNIVIIFVGIAVMAWILQKAEKKVLAIIQT